MGITQRSKRYAGACRGCKKRGLSDHRPRILFFALSLFRSRALLPAVFVSVFPFSALFGSHTALAEPPSAIVTTDLYVRSGPSSDCDALAIAHTNDEVPVLETSDGSWVRIRVSKDGQMVEGYVNSRYLQMPDGVPAERESPDTSDETSAERETPDAAGEVQSENEDPSADPFAGKPGQYLWIGDSRVQGMSLYTHQDVYCAAESADLKWLRGEGEPLVAQALDHFTRSTVILSLGINDLDNAKGYISAFRRLIREFPEKDFYVMSVGPVNEATEAANGYTVENTTIEKMNAFYSKAFPDHYLDVYHWLRNIGFGSNDGVHYTPESCRTLGAYVHLAIPLLRLRNLLAGHSFHT